MASASRDLVRQFVRYLFTGGAAFAVDFGLFALCLYVFDWHYLVANLVG
ncbi:MAG: GtrA family protein, partial [Fibrobacter sp.]|nr:GtrA family protein [Fibrobacter sp.]